MAIIRDPVLFSKQFGVKPKCLADLDLFDSTINADTRLFIDPLLLQHSSHNAIRTDALAEFEKYFGDIISLLRSSTSVGDKPWRSADELFTFKEPRETCLGYGDRTTRGSAIGKALRQQLMTTASEIIKLGVDDPALFALMGLLEAKIGPDRISDMTTRAIKPALYRFNEQVLRKLGIATEKFDTDIGEFNLCPNPFETTRYPVVLVPRDILRPLPIVNDWSDIADAASKNASLRKRVNDTIGDIWRLKTKKDKEAARTAVLTDPKALRALLDAIAISDQVPYDAQADIEGHYLWRAVLAEMATLFPVKIIAPKRASGSELERVVDEIIAAFTDLVENKGQWIHFWHGDKPRHERSAQRLFFAIADIYCKFNDIDISPESHSGAGPVDFKFSSGYDARVLVEVKLSTGKVVHGYEVQLERYKKAESTFRARYLVVNVGRMGKKLEEVLLIKNSRAKKKEPVSPIIEVDGRRKKSASKS